MQHAGLQGSDTDRRVSKEGARGLLPCVIFSTEIRSFYLITFRETAWGKEGQIPPRLAKKLEVGDLGGKGDFCTNSNS